MNVEVIFAISSRLFPERIGTVAKMESLLSQTDLDPMAALLLPGIVKFFGNLMYLYPEQVRRRLILCISILNR